MKRSASALFACLSATAVLLAYADKGVADDAGEAISNTPSVSQAPAGPTSAPSRRPPAQNRAKSRIRPRTSGGHLWGAVAVTLADGGVAYGFVFDQATPDLAVSIAIDKCASMGRSGCYAPVGAVRGCLYVAISAGGQESSAWGTGATPEVAHEKCESSGLSCLGAAGRCSR